MIGGDKCHRANGTLRAVSGTRRRSSRLRSGPVRRSTKTKRPPYLKVTCSSGRIFISGSRVKVPKLSWSKSVKVYEVLLYNLINIKQKEEGGVS